jgi:UDPglucose 6-dehydrogenase
VNKLSILGCGFVGKGVYHGFSPYFDIKIYDKYIKGYDTLEDTVNHSEILFICVPTPYKPNYEQDLSCIYDVVNSIQKITSESKIVIIKSTIVPGTTRKLQNEFPNLRFVFNPEFLTERTFVNDFLNQTRIILGGKDSNDETLKIVEETYKIRFKYTPVLKVKFEEAELVKYMCNCYFATKVVFLNQIYKICENIGIEYETVRQLFVGDQRITDSHTKVPGFDQKMGVGGKCVIPESLLLKDDGKLITIHSLYHKFIRHHKMPKIQSCNSECNKLDFKNIKQVTRRKANEEELLVFETENGKFTCSKEHLIPIYRNDVLQVIQAKDVLETDEVVISDEKCLVMKRQKILKISSVKYSGYLYNLELESNEDKDDLFWIEQNSKMVSHNCFPKDLKSFIFWCESNNFDCDILKVVDEVNERVREHKDWLEIKGATSDNNYC